MKSENKINCPKCNAEAELKTFDSFSYHYCSTCKEEVTSPALNIMSHVLPAYCVQVSSKIIADGPCPHSNIHPFLGVPGLSNQCVDCGTIFGNFQATSYRSYVEVLKEMYADDMESKKR